MWTTQPSWREAWCRLGLASQGCHVCSVAPLSLLVSPTLVTARIRGAGSRLQITIPDNQLGVHSNAEISLVSPANFYGVIYDE